MSVVVGVTDGVEPPLRTDVLVVVNARRRRLTWVPRDVWSGRHECRVNAVWQRFGDAGLREACGDLGLRVHGSLVVRRDASERALADVDVTVPVREPLRYLYPIGREMADGSREVAFDPPFERLRGMRVHEWLGARHAVGRASGDLERVARQQVFVRAFLAGGGMHWRWMLADDGVVASSVEAFAEVTSAGADWRMRTFGPLRPATIDDQQVLVLSRLARLRIRAGLARA